MQSSEAEQRELTGTGGATNRRFEVIRERRPRVGQRPKHVFLQPALLAATWDRTEREHRTEHLLNAALTHH